jgi:hypothetical protein
MAWTVLHAVPEEAKGAAAKTQQHAHKVALLVVA